MPDLSSTSPKGDPVIEPGIPFIRFTSDPVADNDAMVQSTALHRILRADLVYVIAPGGYIGLTTAYEIGRIIQARRPLFFSEQPGDFPVQVPQGRIVTAQKLVDFVTSNSELLCPIFSSRTSPYEILEHDLVEGQFHDD